jgi:serine/threonine-protein kinase
LLRERQAQFQFGFESEKRAIQLMLALTHRIAGDAGHAKSAAEEVRTILESLCKQEPENAFLAAALATAYAIVGERTPALKEAQRAIALLPSNKDAVYGPAYEENLAAIQVVVGDHSRAISTLTRLLQTPYAGYLYSSVPVTPALLRLDPLWDPLRADPDFQKLCEDKAR